MALAALGALTLLRLIVAASVPLVPDEAYYWVWSRALAPGYPDHPPMVALWIRAGTMLAGDGPLGVRLLGPLSMAVASLLLADAARRLLPARATGMGLHAAALLNATLLLGVGGVLMTPDAPLLVFWIACLWALARLVDSANARWWLAIGLFAGLAMASKYTAALLWIGIAIWLLSCPATRVWLRHPAPWAGAIVGIAVFAPVVLWEVAHGWASFTRQGGRFATWHPSEAVRFVAELLGGQVGLITPLVFVLCVAGVAKAARHAWRTRDPAWTLLAALTLPGAALFTQHALGDRVQGNWPAIIYPSAIIAACGLCVRTWQRLYCPAVALGFVITLLVYLQAGLSLLPLPVRFDPIARELAGWDTLAAQVDAARRQAGADFVAADQYGVAAELARSLPPEVTLVGLEGRWAQMALPRTVVAGHVGLLVRDARRGTELGGMSWTNQTEVGQATRSHRDETIETFSLYRIVAAADAAPAVALPRQ